MSQSDNDKQGNQPDRSSSDELVFQLDLGVRKEPPEDESADHSSMETKHNEFLSSEAAISGSEDNSETVLSVKMDLMKSVNKHQGKKKSRNHRTPRETDNQSSVLRPIAETTNVKRRGNHKSPDPGLSSEQGKIQALITELIQTCDLINQERLKAKRPQRKGTSGVSHFSNQDLSSNVKKRKKAMVVTMTPLLQAVCEKILDLMVASIERDARRQPEKTFLTPNGLQDHNGSQVQGTPDVYDWRIKVRPPSPNGVSNTETKKVQSKFNSETKGKLSKATASPIPNQVVPNQSISSKDTHWRYEGREWSPAPPDCHEYHLHLSKESDDWEMNKGKTSWEVKRLAECECRTYLTRRRSAIEKKTPEIREIFPCRKQNDLHLTTGTRWMLFTSQRYAYEVYIKECGSHQYLNHGLVKRYCGQGLIELRPKCIATRGSLKYGSKKSGM